MQLNGHELDITTLRDLIRQRASLGPRPFAIIGDQVLSYADAHTDANRIAHSLRERGICKGDVVATYMFNSVDHVRIWFACAKLGAIWAPLNIALVSRDLEHTISNAQPAVLVADRELLPNVLAIRDRLGPRPPAILVRGDADSGSGGEPLPLFADLLRGSPEEPDAEVAAGDPAGLIYTGGSTGLPKGVLVSNLWYFTGFLRYQEMFRPQPGDVHLGLGQMCHTIGSAVDLGAPFYFGLSTVLSRRFSASRFWDLVRAHRATVTVVVGPLMSVLLNQPARPDDAVNPLRIAGTATGQVPREIAERFAERFDLDLLELYGQTETGPLGCVGQRLDDRPYHSQGKPYGWAELMIEGEGGTPNSPGVTGEIVMRPIFPNTFMLNYYRQPEKFVEACSNLWFHTGDLGHLDEDGYLHFDGRRAHSIRRRGENIAAVEVEQALLQHPAVAECAVVGVPSEVGEEDIKAYLVLADGKAVKPEEIIRFCGELLAYFKVPRYVEFVPELPRSVTKNEIERFKLRAAGIGSAWDRESSGYLLARKV